jgi:hypothetical protein
VCGVLTLCGASGAGLRLGRDLLLLYFRVPEVRLFFRARVLLFLCFLCCHFHFLSLPYDSFHPSRPFLSIRYSPSSPFP